MRTVAVLLAAAGVLVLASCGGDDGSGSSSTGDSSDRHHRRPDQNDHEEGGAQDSPRQGPDNRKGHQVCRGDRAASRRSRSASTTTLARCRGRPGDLDVSTSARPRSSPRCGRPNRGGTWAAAFSGRRRPGRRRPRGRPDRGGRAGRRSVDGRPGDRAPQVGHRSLPGDRAQVRIQGLLLERLRPPGGPGGRSTAQMLLGVRS